MALRHADLGRDAVRTEVAIEPQRKHEPFAIIERRETSAQERTLFSSLELRRAGLGGERLVALEWQRLGRDSKPGSHAVGAPATRGRGDGA